MLSAPAYLRDDEDVCAIAKENTTAIANHHTRNVYPIVAQDYMAAVLLCETTHQELLLSHDPRYPIGRFDRPPSDSPVSPAELRAAIAVLTETPGLLRNAVEGLDDPRLNTPYREGGWTVRQLIHHIADSHMNAFLRLRLALTEDWPIIKPYNEKAWAELHDAAAPVEWSLALIDNLHARWVMLLSSLTEEQWKRGFVHPDNGPMSLEVATLLYGWHSRHHTAHITHLRAKKGW